MTRHSLLRGVGVMLIVSAPALAASDFQAAPGTGIDATRIKAFDDEIARYLQLRRRLRTEVDGLKPGSTAVQIVNASDALAAAIQRARPHAKAGSFFSQGTAVVLKRRISDTIRTENLVPVLATIDDEKAVPGPVTIYRRFPAASQMATMPPSLLAVLPPLPKELEYRIIGTALVLRDVDAALILDFIPGAIPR